MSEKHPLKNNHENKMRGCMSWRMNDWSLFLDLFTVFMNPLLIAGISKLRPTGEMWPVKPFHPNHKNIFIRVQKYFNNNEKTIYLSNIC